MIGRPADAVIFFGSVWHCAMLPALRQLLGFDYPYPQVLDDSDAENAEGRF